MASSSSEVKDILFTIYAREYSYVINAVDKNGIRMSQFKLSFGMSSFPYVMGFAGVGSKLYMIGGCNSYDETQFLGQIYSLDVHIIDIAVFPSFADRDPVTLAVKDPKLNGRKITPKSFVIKYSIYTMSSFFREGDNDVPHFEVLHASQSAWVVLPNPPIDRSSVSESFIEIASYAYTGDKYIVIYVPTGGGVFMFDVTKSQWSHAEVDRLHFLDNAVPKFDGERWRYYAFTLHCQAGYYQNGLYVFDDLMKNSNQELTIRPAPSKIVVCQKRALPIVGETVFVVRCGFAKLPRPDHRTHHTMTVDCFEVAKKFGGQEGDVEYEVVNAKDVSFTIERNINWPPDVIIYCIPLSLCVNK